MTLYFSSVWTLIPPSAVLHRPYSFISFTPAHPVQQGASRCLLINSSYFCGNVSAESNGGQNLDASCWPSWFHQAALLLHHASDAALLCPFHASATYAVSSACLYIVICPRWRFPFWELNHSLDTPLIFLLELLFCFILTRYFFYCCYFSDFLSDFSVQ